MELVFGHRHKHPDIRTDGKTDVDVEIVIYLGGTAPNFLQMDSKGDETVGLLFNKLALCVNNIIIWSIFFLILCTYFVCKNAK